MSQAPTTDTRAPAFLDIDAAVESILGVIDQEREREIISRRFGLFERKETLEQIGELLGITRERVRQLEKAVIQKLKAAGKQHSLSGIDDFQLLVVEQLEKTGEVMRVSDLTTKLVEDPSRTE